IWKTSGSSLWRKNLSFAVVLFESSIRPNGWPLPLIAVSYWISLQLKHRLAKLVVIAALFISFGYGLSRVQLFVAETPLSALNNGVIIWGYPHAFVEPVGPRSLDWRKLGLYVVRNPVRTMK